MGGRSAVQGVNGAIFWLGLAAFASACTEEQKPVTPTTQLPNAINSQLPDGGGQTPVISSGDGDGDAGTEAPIDPNAPTWHGDIAPLVNSKCSGCHKEGGIAPFSLEHYDTAKAFAGLMAREVEEGRMPPFLAQETKDCTPPLPWKNDI